MPHPLTAEQRRERSGALHDMVRAVNLPFADRDWISNSRKALEASEFARDAGRFDAFHRAVFHAYFAEGRDIGDTNVLRDIANDVGLDAAAMSNALEAGTYSERINEDVDLAATIGLTGVPAFIIGNRAIIGAQPYELFERVMAMLGAEKRQRDSPLSETN